MGALRQEDPELYEMCLDYPNRRVKEQSLAEQGFMIADVDEDEEDSETYSTEEVEQMKDDGEPLEIHTNKTIERFNEDVEDEPLRRLYHDEEEDVYKPIVQTDDKSESDEEDERQIIQPPKPKASIKMSIHQDNDIQMLWGVNGELDFSKKFCSAVIDCEVVKFDQMELAIGIVERAKERESNGEQLMPVLNIKNNDEFKDATKLSQWRQCIKGNKTTHKLQDSVKIYLDESLPGWGDEIDDKQIKKAKEIVSRAKGRMEKLKTLIPVLPILIENPINEEEEQERKDAMKINTWKKSLKGEGRKRISILTYLDTELPGWNNSLEEVALNKAKAIVSRANVRVQSQGNFIPISIYNATTEIEKQEVKDAKILGMWKLSLKGKSTSNLYESVKKYLDENLNGWRDEYSAINQAKEIVERAIKRKHECGRLLPKDYHISKSIKTDNIKILTEIQESRDAAKIVQWRNSLKGGSSTQVCPLEVKQYLDKHLIGWYSNFDDRAFQHVVELVKRAKLRKNNGGKLLPTRHDKKTPDKRSSNDKQEDKDARKLTNLKLALNKKARGKCCDEVRDYLDKELPGWRPIEPDQTSVPITPIAPPPKKRKLILKKQTAIPIATTKETTTTHHFSSPSEIVLLHKEYRKMRSDTLNAKFKTDPQLWCEYHATRKRNFASYDPASIPSNQIIRELEKIQTKRRKVVVDMGCGEAPIAHHFQNDNRFTFHNYDHQSGGDSLIQEVDISALPLDDADAEIAIMSLALWGTKENCTQYIKEAYRVLESGGKFYISDSTKKWSPEPLTPENGGELLRTLLTANGFKIINEVIGIPFCFFECNKMY